MVTTVSGALREALKPAMREDESVFLMGEDIAEYGGIYKATRGLYNEFGRNRVIDTPMAEVTIVGAGIGAAVSGMRPVVEIMYADFLPITMDQIVNNAAKFYFLSGGRTPAPLVVRANFGSGKGEGALQSQTPEAWFMNVPGLKVVMPSDAQDAYGLLLSSIRDDNPVLFFEHKMLYPFKGELDAERELPALGKAVVKRKGRDVTIVSCGLMLQPSLEDAVQGSMRRFRPRRRSKTPRCRRYRASCSGCASSRRSSAESVAEILKDEGSVVKVGEAIMRIRCRAWPGRHPTRDRGERDERHLSGRAAREFRRRRHYLDR